MVVDMVLFICSLTAETRFLVLAPPIVTKVL